MTPRSTKKRRKKRAPKAKPKRKAPKRKRSSKKTIVLPNARRSEASKKGWEKRRAKLRIAEQMRAEGWELTELPTGHDILDFMEWMAERHGTSIGRMFEMAYGYKSK